MAAPDKDIEARLTALGQRMRQGWAKRHPIPDKSLESVRDAVRQEWERERTATPEAKPLPKPARDRRPLEPDPGR